MRKINSISARPNTLTKDEKGKDLHSIFLWRHFEVVIVIIRKKLYIIES